MTKKMVFAAMLISCFITQAALSKQRNYESTGDEYLFSFNNDNHLAQAIDALEKGLWYASLYTGMQEPTWGRAILKSFGLAAGGSCVKYLLYAFTRNSTAYSVTLSAADETDFKAVQDRIRQLAWISKKQKKLILKTVKKPTDTQSITVCIFKNKAITESSFCGIKITKTSCCHQRNIQNSRFVNE